MYLVYRDTENTIQNYIYLYITIFIFLQLYFKKIFLFLSGHSWNEVDIDEAQEDGGSEDTLSTPSESEVTPFRGRASTDGHLLSRPRRWRYPPPVSQAAHCRADRRMSISMRGNNASC